MKYAKRITLENYIVGHFTGVGETRVIHSPLGDLEAVIASAPEAELRKAKRALFGVLPELSAFSIGEMAELVKKIERYYFADSEQLNLLSALTGSPRRFLESSIARRLDWAARIDSFIDAALPKDTAQSFSRTWEPRGPVVTILPRNSDEESFYVLVQALLARCPVLMKTAASGCSSFSALEFVRALNRVLDEYDEPRYAPLRMFANVCNLFAPERIFDQLYVQGSTFVVFGSQDTVNQAACALTRTASDKVLSFGMGFASSIVLEDAQVEKTCTELFRSMIANNGTECIATTVAYIHSKSYEPIVSGLKKLIGEWEGRDVKAIKDELGSLPTEELQAVARSLEREGISASEVYEGNRPKPVIIEASAETRVAELPAPVMFVKRVESLEEATDALVADLRSNALATSICCSIFTSRSLSRLECKSIPAYCTKINCGTHRINVFAEHQGVSLFREMLTPSVHCASSEFSEATQLELTSGEF